MRLASKGRRRGRTTTSSCLVKAGQNRSYFSEEVSRLENSQYEKFDDILSNIQTSTPEATERAFRLLDEIWKDQEKLPGKKFSDILSPDLLCNVLKHWRSSMSQYSDQLGKTYSTEVVLSRIESYETMSSTKAYFLLVDTASKSGNSVHTADFADRALKSCLSKWKNGSEACRPTTALYNLVLSTFIRSGQIDATVKCRSLINDMERFEIPMNRTTYERILQAYCLSKDFLSASSWLDKMKKDPYVEVTVFAYCFVIQANIGSKGGTPRAEALFAELLSCFGTGPIDCDPSLIISALNATLHCAMNETHPLHLNRVEALFDKAKNMGLANEMTYSQILSHWARRGQLKRCEKLLKHMLSEDLAGTSQVRLSADMFAKTISSYSRSPHPDNIHCALRIMNIMEEANIATTTGMLNALIGLLVNSKLHIKQAEKFLRRMTRLCKQGKVELCPDETSYRMLINGYAKFGNADMAFAWLKEMVSDYEHGVHSSKPGLNEFNCVLGAYIRSKRREASTQALLLLRDAELQYEKGLISFCPDKHSYSSVIASLSKSKDGGHYLETALPAEDLLNEMRKKSKNGDISLRPDRVAYNSVINAWARAKRPDEAGRVLDMMKSDARDGNRSAAPNNVTYNTLIKAIMISDGKDKVRRVENILELMNAAADKGDESMRPSVSTYTSVIVCYGLEKHPNAIERAEELLETMKRLKKQGISREGPNHKTYRAVRRIWEASSRRDKVSRIATLDREFKHLTDSSSSKSQARGNREWKKKLSPSSQFQPQEVSEVFKT